MSFSHNWEKPAKTGLVFQKCKKRIQNIVFSGKTNV